MKDETLTKVTKLIASAEEHEIRTMQDAIQARFKVIQAQRRNKAMATINIGDQAILINLKPKYLNGTRVEVIEKKASKFTCRLSDNADPRAIRRFGRTAIVPATCLEVV